MVPLSALPAYLESWIDAAFRYGHGWPAVGASVVFLVLCTLGVVKALDLFQDWCLARAIRREMAEASSPAVRARERDAAARLLANVEPVSEERERQVLDAMASIGSQPPRGLPHERTIRVEVR